MLSTRQLRYFETLAETLHFGRAARRLNISQPALSAQIAQMEALFGASLFERRPSGPVLTAEGAAILGRVRRIMGELRDLEALADNGGGLLTGRLKLGVIASVAPYLLPGFLPALADAYPALTLGLRENVTDVLLEELARGELDCALVASAVETSSIRTIDLAEDPFVLAVPTADARRIPSPVRLASLHDERLILLEEGHCLRDQALSVCRIAEVDRMMALGATSLATLLRMVAGGLGVTLAPTLAVATERDAGLAFLPFEAPAPSRRLVLAVRASSGRVGDFEALAKVLRAALAEAIREGGTGGPAPSPDQRPAPG